MVSAHSSVGKMSKGANYTQKTEPEMPPWKTSTQALPAMVLLLYPYVFSQVPSIFSQVTDWGIAARTWRRRRVKLSLRIVHTACAAGGNTSGESGVRAGGC